MLSRDGKPLEVKAILAIQPVLVTLAFIIDSVNGICQSSNPDNNPLHLIGMDFSSGMPILIVNKRELRYRQVG